MEALNHALTANAGDVLFNLPETQGWLDQLMLSLTLICRGSFRGVKEVLRDRFDAHVSLGTIHNRIQCATMKAAAINRTNDLYNIRVGRHDEIFQRALSMLPQRRCGIDLLLPLGRGRASSACCSFF